MKQILTTSLVTSLFFSASAVAQDIPVTIYSSSSFAADWGPALPLKADFEKKMPFCKFRQILR